MYIDTHAHLQNRSFTDDLADVLKNARDKCVRYILAPGITVSTSQKGISLNRKYPGIIPAVGAHPHNAKGVRDDDIGALEKMAAHENVVALGEIGLDFHYNYSSVAAQEHVLRRLIDVAHRVKKPLILHSRELQQRIVEILKEEHAPDLGGVVQ